MRARVTFLCFGAQVASSRYRAIIPARELALLGVDQGKDVLVIGKHGWSWDEATAGYKRVVFDVCDDHLNDPAKATHYHEAIARADAVTCNSPEMQRRIKAVCGRDAWVIPDPYEQPEAPPRLHGESLLWYGFGNNLQHLVPWLDRLGTRPITCVTKNVVARFPAHVQIVDWSPQAMDQAYERAGLVLVPTGERPAKSANRAIEAIRRGLYPICGPGVPAYADLGVWVGRMDDGVEWALSHHDDVIHRIQAAQHYVAWEYSPKRIAKLWLEVLSQV
jgi:hypothetical protein